MKHGLTGYLAGLSVLVGALESPRVLSCLTRCQEALDTPAMELLQPSMELLTNNGVCVCVCVCVYFSLFFSVCFYISVYFSVFVSLAFSISLFLYFSLSVSIFLSLYIFVSLSFSVSISLSLFPLLPSISQGIIILLYSFPPSPSHHLTVASCWVTYTQRLEQQT